MAIEIKINEGLSIDTESQKRALKAVGSLFIKECRKVLNAPTSQFSEASLPHNVSGLLSRSIRFKVTSRKGDVFVRISANTRYATALFSGSPERHTVARDLFAYVMNKLKPQLNQVISEAIKLD
ncbi:hypothetical protein [Gluconobacter frateurii]|uniref:HK97 gp10 family phage protein n=1 Tax=Gluconobacter frateurii NRIC 0228 TaxID=1307946 RepID=A0ABQ0QFX5_9PROT|nr:hypothetical protein [Gluconobacter frateurii]GBR17527.1 hypothetical protein AA0228_3048 [Gluconobacter frateurii NRIC 0228]GLP91998.1 hypothetical protein GCM10007868_30730 [Gluconobacter frateurii]